MRLRAWVGFVSCVLLQLLVPFARAGAETDTATVQGRVTLSVSGARVSQLGPVVVYWPLPGACSPAGPASVSCG